MDNMDKNGIYKIINNVNGDYYIGSTANKLGFKERWKVHRRDLRNNNHCNDYLQKAWNKYGEEAFEFKIVEICEKDECIKLEQKYLDNEKPKYNLCKTAGNTLGRKHSKETRVKISQNREYSEPWNKGLTMSETSKQKMSIAQKNSTLCRENIIKLNKSKRKPVIGVHIETGEEIELEYMKQDPRFFSSGIKACISGKIKSYKKYKWSFKNS